jgi:3-keto-disaccharide hydrolase
MIRIVDRRCRLGSTVLFAFACLIAPLAQAQFYGATNRVMGDYQGFWSSKDGKEGRVTAQIRALENGAYDGFILLDRSRSTIAAIQLGSVAGQPAGTVLFKGTPAESDAGSELMPTIKAMVRITDRGLRGSFSGDIGTGTLEAQRTIDTSPTLGAAPPRDAIVLFDGKSTDHWVNFHWKRVGDGAMQAQGGALRVKDRLRDFKLHVEFRTPFKPAARGQERGNSGVYLQRKYEVQVLDSFGLYPLENNDCGAVYKLAAPHRNACLPPMQWQTYDLTYHDGNPVSHERPTVTVVQNGVTIIDNFVIPADHVAKGTGGGDAGQGGFLKLQYHNNPVQFRNIWVQPLAR